jgi:hypothetical protein
MIRGRSSTLALILALASSGQAAPAGDSAFGHWRVIRVSQAPWIDGAARLGPADLAPGDVVSLSADGVDAPAVLACPGHPTTLALDPEDLFDGELERPARQSRRLGLPSGPVTTLRIDCGDSRWDFHRADDDSLLFALDGRIIMMARGFGTRASADSAAGTVQRLLEAHFTGSMRFEAEEWAALDPFLGAELRKQLAAWFAEPWPQGLPTAVRADPLTHGDEPAMRFHVLAEDVQGERAAVTVDIIDAYGPRRLVYAMGQEGGAWRLLDLHDETGESLTDSLVILPD